MDILALETAAQQIAIAQQALLGSWSNIRSFRGGSSDPRYQSTRDRLAEFLLLCHRVSPPVAPEHVNEVTVLIQRVTRNQPNTDTLNTLSDRLRASNPELWLSVLPFFIMHDLLNNYRLHIPRNCTIDGLEAFTFKYRQFLKRAA